MKRKKIIRIILLSVVVLAAGAGLYIYREYNRKNADLKRLKPAYTLSPASLIREFSNDEQTAYKKYLGKVLEIKGNCKDMIRDEKGYYTLVLGEGAMMSSVRCSMDSSHSNELNGILPGAALSVKGICTGYNADQLLGMDIILNRGVLQN